MEYAATGSWSTGTRPRSPSRATYSGSTSRSESGMGQPKLNFEQAMADFQTMFPDMDLDVIEETLRANQGAVETTIDQLLLLSSSPRTAHKIDLTQDSKGKSKSHPVFSHKTAVRWNPPLVGPLPDDFLRVVSPRSVRMESYTVPEGPRSTMNVGQVIEPRKSVSTMSLKGKSSTKAKSNSIPGSSEINHQTQEHYHQFLQNEEFLRELQQDEEFMKALQKDAKVRAAAAGRDNTAFHSTIDSAASGTSSSSGIHSTGEDSSDFQSKLRKNMGQLAKERLNLFAKQFSRGKNKTPKNILTKSTPSSYDHLIEDSNSLVSDDDDHDDHLAEGNAHVRLEKKNP